MESPENIFNSDDETIWLHLGIKYKPSPASSFFLFCPFLLGFTQEGELDAVVAVHSYEDGMPAGSHKTRLTALNVCRSRVLFFTSTVIYLPVSCKWQLRFMKSWLKSSKISHLHLNWCSLKLQLLYKMKEYNSLLELILGGMLE